ncbi:BMC domain-containing protein [Evansella tamaricis]|uniref:BMC domain-containing protein n=1 Tax=Evansella tamaricis TaxID=2069301 RepID=A0ABS6JKW2_9BACI|nr:BMC domain-containing protein [Evansella tamaricis]MBU9714221.1 BMC domain-containing protein [Evansella tamaricis]
MKRYEAIGVLETQYFTFALELVDKVCKASNVDFLTSENYLGGRLVTIIVGGSISDVNEAVETARQICEKKESTPLKKALTITNPHEEILKFILPSSSPSSGGTDSALEETGIKKEWKVEVSQKVEPKRTRKRKPKSEEE